VEIKTDYRYSGLAQEIRSGHVAIPSLAPILDGAGARRAMVICGPNILAKSDVVQRVEAVLGDRFVGRFTGVAPHSPLDVLHTATDAARRLAPDVLVSVGGGSTVTIAKGVSLLLATDRDIRDFQLRFEPPDRVIESTIPFPDVVVPIVAVSTTMGCAEVGPSGGGFTDEHRGEKVMIAGRGRTTPRYVIIDGEALATTPPATQKGTAVGQLRVAIEAVISTNNNVIGDALALHAIKVLGAELREWRQDPSYLLAVKAACVVAGLARVATGSLGVNTAIAHHVGAIFDVPHGDANAILLPHTLRFNSPAASQGLALVADALGDAQAPAGIASGEFVAQRVVEVCVRLGLQTRLRDVGVPAEGLTIIAEATLGDPGLSSNPEPIKSREQIEEILRLAW
jgi:alcohol dehydrogenase class IV